MGKLSSHILAATIAILIAAGPIQAQEPAQISGKTRPVGTFMTMPPDFLQKEKPQAPFPNRYLRLIQLRPSGHGGAPIHRSRHAAAMTTVAGNGHHSLTPEMALRIEKADSGFINVEIAARDIVELEKLREVVFTFSSS